ncbi:hypothetical protein CON62_31480 [Bacillus toyonensis]|nr:hypothetical protein CON62_31480 [Bacillus toyonensis]
MSNLVIIDGISRYLNLSNLEGNTSRLEQGWNHENTFVPFLGMSVFFYGLRDRKFEIIKKIVLILFFMRV